MQSKKSCFNRAAFTKNLTRFAPVLALYTLLLLLVILMAWKQAGDIYPEYYFLYQSDELFIWTAVFNLGYACLMAQLQWIRSGRPAWRPVKKLPQEKPEGVPRKCRAGPIITCTIGQVGRLSSVSLLPTSGRSREACNPQIQIGIPY